MSLKPYSEYKDSGIEWLGKVPETWHVKRISWLFKVISSGTTPPNEKHEYYEGAFNWVTTGELRERGILETKRTVTSEALKTFSALRIYPSGTLLIAMYGATIGRLGFLEAPATTNQACCAFAEPIQTIPRFIFYVFHALREHLLVIADGGGQPNINQEKLRSLRVPHPTYEEQQAIADYLDRETAEIDAFIEDQEELIALLGERRTATITRAVTKGLNVKAPMKASGVEWLDEVPEHWTITKLKHLGYIKYGLGEPPAYVDEGVPLIRATNVSLGNITPEKLAKVNPEDIPFSRIFWLRTGDIIVVRSGALTGDSAIITTEYEGSIAGFDMVFRADKNTNPTFIQYSLLAPYVKSAQIDQVRIRAAQPHLNSEELGDCLIAIPPCAEQNEISNFLEQETAELDATIVEAREAITLSKERRAAVISAAVTGKIDVRNAVNPAATQLESVSVVLGS